MVRTAEPLVPLALRHWGHRGWADTSGYAGEPLGQPESDIESGDTTDTVAQAKKVLALVLKIKHALKAVEGKSDEEAREVFASVRTPLLDLNKCPDFVVNRGHYFGTSYVKDKDEPGLSDDDKRALIEFLKTF